MSQVNIIGTLGDQSVVQAINGGLYNMLDNTQVLGSASVPWAKFVVNSSDPTVGIDPTILCNYMISDRQIYPGGGSPIFLVDPLGAGNKRFLQSSQMYVEEFADRPTASDFPWMTMMIGDFGNALAISDGTDWVSKHWQHVYQEQNGTLASPTNSTTSGACTAAAPFLFSTSMPVIPANLIVPSKTIMRCNFLMQRRGAVGTYDFAIRLGTTGNYATPATLDPIVTYQGAVTATDLRHLKGSPKLSFPSATIFNSTRNSPDEANGTNATQASGAQFDVTQPNILTVSIPGKASGDIVDLISLEWVWQR